MATRVEERIAPPTYKVLSSLREGAVAELHIVRHQVFPKDRVRKRVDLFGIDEAIGLQEPRLLEDIEHPNIVKVHEANYDQAFPGTRPVCFYMDYYPERSILTALEHAYAFPILDAVRIVRDILHALQYVHEVRRYVHRDVKPANVLLESGRTRGLLADFGEAARIGEDGKVAASGGSVLYHPPEWGSGRVTSSCDLYALGLVLHEMLSGPFDYASYDGDEASNRIKEGRRAIPDRDLDPAPHVPRQLQRVVRRAIHRDPNRRFQRAADFRDALMAARVIGWRRTADGWVGPDSGSLFIYRVTEEPRRSGVRLIALRQTHRSGPWRRFGINDRDADPSDKGAYATFFEDTLARALQRSAS
ncbi:MAG: eukaryotic-like serine/threonine-protein kinase [bacterium]